LSQDKEFQKQKMPRPLKRKKKPEFRRQESWRYKRVKESWRKPRGLDNKMRKRVKGWPPSPNKGYRDRKSLRGIHPSGFQEAMITSINDLEKVNPEYEAVRIGHTVGDRKRTEIISKAKEMGIHILNPGKAEETEEPT